MFPEIYIFLICENSLKYLYFCFVTKTTFKKIQTLLVEIHLYDPISNTSP